MSTASVGAWTVTAVPGEVTAHRRGSNETYSANVIPFPVGYKVGQRWSPEQPPKSVLALANRLARQLNA